MLKFKSHMFTPPTGTCYTQPETGYSFPWDTDINLMFDAIKAHRKAHGLTIQDNWKDDVEHQMAMTLKAANVDDWLIDTENPVVPRLVSYGRAMWAELHARALAYPDKPDEYDKANEIKWLEGWKARIPSAKCECAYKWLKMGLDFDISCRSGYYASTVAVHDAVRASLGQPWMDGEFRHLITV